MSDESRTYLAGYQQALRDAVEAVEVIEVMLQESKDARTAEFVGGYLRIVKHGISTLEPGLMATSAEPPRS